MNRQYWRACRRAAGFSFVELLVTIVIAGIAFAAIVPLFVQAQSRNSADNSRNIALQLAQDKIEKVRQLDYDQITQENLESSTYAGGQFGETWDFTRNGVTKTYEITYDVQPVPETATLGQEQYKKVVISVTWSGPPTPAKAAVLQTLVYRQYAGPEIRTVNVGPPTIFDINLPDVPTIIASPVVIDAYLSAEDIASMDATNPDPEERGWVNFSVSPFTGMEVEPTRVNAVHGGELGHYQYVWDNSAVPDGVYRIEVTAFSAAGVQGATAVISYPVSILLPPTPTGLTATPGDSLVSLSWDPAHIGDFLRYEVWRGETSGGETLLASMATPSYIDQPLSNGTTYYYKVRVVDQDGNESPLSDEVDATPAVQFDVDPPTTPTGLTATKLANTGTINLAWVASTDVGTPPSGMLGYIIERSATGTDPWVVLDTDFPDVTYPDSSAGWGSTWYYRVAAVDVNLNFSPYSAVAGPVTTDPQPKYSLTVNNTRSSDIYVWVQNVGTGQWYSTGGVPLSGKPAGERVKKNKTVVWRDLPSGVYNVYASTSTGGTPPLSSISGSGDLTAGNNSITY